MHGDTAYGAWRDAGLVMIDVANRAQPKLITHRNWSPPFGGGTHNCLPLPDRDLLVVLDEAVLDHQEDGLKLIWMFDIREPENPVSIATFPTPAEADYVRKGGHFGPHNIHENRPGSFVSSELIFATYQNAGVRVFDIRDQYHPVEVGALVPPQPERTRRPSAEPRSRHSVHRRIRRPQWDCVLHGLQCRALHHGVLGLTAGTSDAIRAPRRWSISASGSSGWASPRQAIC